MFEEAFTLATSTASWSCTSPATALIAQPESVAYGGEQVGAALQGFLVLEGRITLDTKLVFTIGEVAYLSNSWSLSGPGPDGNPVAGGHDG